MLTKEKFFIQYLILITKSNNFIIKLIMKETLVISFKKHMLMKMQ